ncbi:TPA: DNA-binding protein HU [Patescibacteria group bacterium]|uniref:DNA-binding protein HU-beta n=1 Tax=candidate division Kazan bacterium GW2011_GWA1_44_22 TaxID=1620410 RepID=A0A0G1K9T9_UNCK3|nr:MAG: DNA-binding protein HU-beta [candidate division Kazan bacterium GW2011_GWA1_44_22]HAR55066.1 DNA-binding protein HU [Patescibacteria group bacterium]HCR42063.1 DNA-binding protein HU [Patescibacteria group bacterium]
MNKSQIIELISRKANVSKKTATQAMDILVNTVKSNLAAGKTVTITGFGTFSVSSRTARNGVNPQTGKPIRIPSSKVPRFKAGKALRSLIH